MTTLDKLPYAQRASILRRIRRLENAKQKKIREMIKEAREKNLLAGLSKELWLPSAVLRDRSMKAWRKAQQWHKGAEYLDYEIIIAERPRICRICGREMDDEHLLAIVHKQSLETGGLHLPDNIEVIHTKCHRQNVKGARKPDPSTLPMEEFIKQWEEKHRKP